MDKQTTIIAFEFIFSFFALIMLFKRLPLIKLSYNEIFLIFLFFLITAISAFITDGDYSTGLIKLMMFCLLIFFGYSFSRYSPIILVLFILLCSLQNYQITGALDKFSVVPLSFIALLLSAIYSEEKNEKNVKYIIMVLIILDILQGVYTHYRGQLLYCFLSLICLTFNISIKKKVSAIFFAAPIGYIVIMYIMGLYYFSYFDPIFPPTASNIERSSMIYWSLNSITEFLMSAPTVSYFQDNAGQFKTLYAMPPSVPNDPHSFLIMSLVFFGFINSVIIYFFVMNVVRKATLSLSSLHGKRCEFISLAFLQVIIIFSTHPFNSFSRIFFGLMFGIFIAFGSGKFNKEASNDGKY